MLKRIAVLVVLLLAVGAGSLTSSASAAPQASKLAWVGDPTQPDDCGDSDEPDPGVRRAVPGEPHAPSLQGDPTQPGDGLFRRILIWMGRLSWRDSM
jgi:hypothetical protein